MDVWLLVIVAAVAIIIGIAIGSRFGRDAQMAIDQQLLREKEALVRDLSILNTEKKQIQVDIEKLISQRERQKEEDNKILEEYYNEKKKLIDQQISTEFEFSREKLKQNIAEIAQKENDRLSLQLEENRAEFSAKMEEMEIEKKIAYDELQELLAKRRAAIEVAKHEDEIRKQSQFYSLQISQQDISDIEELKLIERKLHKKEVLNKLIYKVYFEKAYTNLVGRVVGKEIKTGIYKITNLNDNRIYIGQAVNIAERWKQHIKRALGAEPMTQNKLYPAMAEEGVWNFTFEIVEECEKKDLSSREQYWQNFFGAKEFGYSIK